MNAIPLLAFGFAAGAIFCLFQRWRNAGAYWLPLAMTALAVSAGLWVSAYGAEYGLLFCLLSLILGAIVCIAYNSQTQAPKPVRRRRVDWTYDRGSYPELAAELAVAGVLAPLAAAGCLIALVHALPWPMASKMALAALCFPVFWALLSLGYRLLNRSRHYVGGLSVLAAATLGLYFGQQYGF